MTTAFVQERLDRVLTQYRESPNLLAVIAAGARQAEEIALAADAMPPMLDLETAEGEWLDIIGRAMGFVRRHCVCLPTPVFGFPCDDPDPLQPVVGFCDGMGTWRACDATTGAEYELTDDDTYRRFLKVRALQLRLDFSERSLLEAARIAFGDEAEVLRSNAREVVIAPGEDFDILHPTAQLWQRVMPVPPWVKVLFHVGSTRALAGFGAGWTGFCGVADVPLETERGEIISDETGEPLIADGIADDTHWVCGFNPTIC